MESPNLVVTSKRFWHINRLMSVSLAVWVGVLSFGLAWGSIPLIIRRFRGLTPALRQLHHTHKVPIPRIGGIALVIPFLLVALFVFFWLPPAPDRMMIRLSILVTGALMFLLGFIDDLSSLGAKRKLLGQIAIASGAWFGGIQIVTFANPFNTNLYELSWWLSWPLTVVWLVALTNLVNLADGIDGLAGGIGFMLMFLLVFVGWGTNMAFTTLCAVAMCGALLGFLCHNFPPAKIYMGDGGAYFIGFLIGLLSIVSSHKGTVAGALVAPAFALALPIIDVSLAILRRGLKGLPVFRPDRRHIHHRLQAGGLSRRQTVLLLYGISLVFLGSAFAIFLVRERWLPLAMGSIFLGAILIAGRFSFSREWLSISRVVGNSLEMRKDVQYALLLARWLELESERCETVDDLWNDFKFVVQKVDFAKVELHLDGTVCSWKTLLQPGEEDEFRIVTHDLPGNHAMALHFAGHSEVMSPEQFEIISELMAEAWMKATRRWQSLHNKPIWLSVTASRDVVGAQSPTTPVAA